MYRPLLCLALVSTPALLPACAPDEAGPTIAVVGKAVGGEYWGAVKRGAQAQADRSKVKLLYRGPGSERDVPGQIALVEDLIRRKVLGIAISPTNSTALGPVVKEAIAAGIKVVTIDSDTTAHDRLCYIGTNNVAAGEVAGREMLKLLPPGRHRVAVVTGVVGAQNLKERIEGFKAAVGDRVALAGVVPDNGDKDKSMAIAANALGANPDLAGIFTTTAIGGPAAAQAIRTAGREGEVKLVCFDTTPTLLKQLKAGTVQVLIAQRPDKMGELAVEKLLAATKGEALPGVIDTGVVAVTKANVGEFE